MAEVTGNIGGQPVELNNAATEATLRQLLNAMRVMGEKMGVDAKRQAQLDKEVQKFKNQLDKGIKSQEKSNKLKDKENKALDLSAKRRKREEELALKSEKATQFMMGGLERFGHQALGLATKLTGVMSSFANMGNSFGGAAATFNNIPVVGGMLGSVFGAVASSADKLYTSFKSAASVGANFNGSMRDMIASASSAGLTVEQYGQIIKTNSQDLALFGGSTQEGAKRMANMAKIMRKGEGPLAGMQNDLARLGYSAEDINSGFAKYSSMLAKSGSLQGKTDAELAAGTANYLKQLDAVSRLTGETRESQEQENARRMADAKTRSMLARLGDDAGNMQQLFNALPASMRKGAEEVFATGAARSKEAQEFMVMYGSFANDLQKAGYEARRTGKFSAEGANELYKSVKRAADTVDMGFVDTVARFSDDMQGAALGMYELRARQGDLESVTKEQAKGLAEAGKKNKDSLDPAQMLRMQQEIAQTSNKFNELLAQHLPKLQAAFTALADFVDKFLTPAFTFFMDNLGTVTTVIGGLIVAIGTAKAAMSAMKAYQDWKNLGKERGSNPASPMYVEDVGGGGGLGGGKGKKGKMGKAGKGVAGAAKNLGNARGLVKGLGVAGTLVSAGMLVSDLSDISQQEKEGKITKGEANEAKGGAVGSAVGGAGGAWAGAAAGAAIGSVVPVVGTVIGGAIGAALGGWLGSKGGEIAGKEVGKAVTATPTAGSQDWMKINDKNINSWVDAVYEGRYKIEQVPGVYLPYVKERLAKKPVKANPPPVQKPAPAATQGAKSSEAKTSKIDYGASPEDLLKQFATANKSVLAEPKNQSSALKNVPVATAEQSITAEAEKKKLEAEKERAQLEAKKTEEAKKSLLGAGQESSETMLAALNTNMSQLVKLMKDQNSLTESQLSATKNLSGDLFAA